MTSQIVFPNTQLKSSLFICTVGKGDVHPHAVADVLGLRHAVLSVLQLRNDVGLSKSVIRSAT